MLSRARTARLLALFCCTTLFSAISARGWAQEEPAAEQMAEFAPSDWEAQSYFDQRWNVRVGTVILQRARLASSPFAYNANTGETIINANSYDFPFRGGIDVAAIRRGDVADIDFRYFGIDQWNASQGDILAPAGATLNIPDIEPSPFPVLINNTTYGSELHSAEINLRQNVTPYLTLLGGFRYVSFRESLSLDVNVGPGIQAIDIGMGSNNRLYGAQIGADTILWDGGGRFRVEGVGKVGIFGNSASNSFFEDFGAGAISLGASRTQTAFVGDLNFTGVYQLTDHLGVRAGYQLLWLAGVAIAEQQPPGFSLNNGTVTVDAGGNAFFHGALVGLEYGW